MRVSGLSRDKLTMGNIYMVSKETAYDMVFRYPRQNSQSDFFNTKPPKIAFLNGFLSHCWEKDRWWHDRFYLKMRETGILRQNFELVCWDRFRNDISQKYVLSLVSNRWMQLNCKIELYTLAKLSWITYELKFNFSYIIIRRFST